MRIDHRRSPIWAIPCSGVSGRFGTFVGVGFQVTVFYRFEVFGRVWNFHRFLNVRSELERVADPKVKMEMPIA